MIEWPKHIPCPEFWKMITNKHRKEALFTIYRMASYEDLYRWMALVDPLTPEVRMEVLRNVKFVRKVYLASLRFRGDIEWAEESESGERMDEFDDQVIEQPDPIEWDSFSENLQNIILAYITSKDGSYIKLEKDLIKEDPELSDLDQIINYSRFSKYIFIQVNMLRERMESDEEFSKIFTFCLSDYSKEVPRIELDKKHPRAIARESWNKYINRD